MHVLTSYRGVPAFVTLVFGLAYGIGFGAMLLDRVLGLDLLSEPYVYIILIVVAWLPTTIGFIMSGTRAVWDEITCVRSGVTHTHEHARAP